MVRAVAALNDKYVEGWFDALDDCCAKKRQVHNVLCIDLFGMKIY